MYTKYEQWRDGFHVGGVNPEIQERRHKCFMESRTRYEIAVKNDYLITMCGKGCNDACDRCEHLYGIGMRDEDDDVELMYCDNKECRYHIAAKIEEKTRDFVTNRMFSEATREEFRFLGVKLYGSFAAGTETETSDIDVLIEYKGTMREDAVFNILHENPLHLYGRVVDINPIKADKSGTIEEYLSKTGHKCLWSDCPFNKDNRCKQKDGGGIKYGMDKMGRYLHERQPEEVKQHCRCCVPDLGQYNNKMKEV